MAQSAAAQLPGLSLAATAQLRCWLYGRHNPLEVITWLGTACQASGGLTSELQQAVLDLITTSDPILTAAPLEPQYSQRLLKHLVTLAESQGQELSDELVEAYTQTLQAPVPSPSDSSGGDSNTVWMLRTVCYGPVGTPAHTQHSTHDITDTSTSQSASGDSTSCCDLPGAPTLQHHAARLRTVLAQLSDTAANDNTVSVSPQHADTATALSDTATGAPAASDTPIDTAQLAGVISLRVSGDMLQGGTGCSDWEAGYVLSELLINRPELVRGLRCIELGSGCGTVGITAARVGASHVLMTDSGDEGAMSNCVVNCRLNGLRVERLGGTSAGPGRQDYNTAPLQSPSVQVGVLNWVACATSAQGQPHTASDVTLQGHYDVILASDVVYDPEVLPAFVHTLKSLLCCRPADTQRHSHALKLGRSDASARQPYALVASTVRNESTLKRFIDLVSEAGLCVETLAHGALTQNGVASDAQDGAHTAPYMLSSIPVQFLYMSRVDAARSRVAIHRIQCKS